MRYLAGRTGYLLSMVSLVFLTPACGVQDQLYEGDPCKLHSGDPGVCRLAKDCPWLRSALLSHAITYSQLVRCGFEGEEPIICCRTEPLQTRIDVRPAVKACSTYYGQQLSYHIIGGEAAKGGEIPFIGALGYKKAGDGEYDWSCGASLIAPRFLLSAAHCMTSSKGLPDVVRMGALNLLAPAIPAEVQDRSIKNIIVHPSNTARHKYDDIALLEVDSPFQYSDLVQPTCLNTVPEDLSASVVLMAAGWGYTMDAYSPEVLLRTNLTTVPLEDCRKAFVQFTKRLRQSLLPTQYCAGADGRDTCDGDSGGPLYYVEHDLSSTKHYLVGITSFGIGCGFPQASVYTRVSSYIDWIESHVWPPDVPETDI